MLIYERSLDLTAALHHSWIYLPLLVETANFENNRITLTNAQNEGFDLDPKVDTFWSSNMVNPFPKVGENLDIEMKSFKSDMDAMGHRKVGSSIDEYSKNLENAMDLVPEITQRKKCNETHTKITSHIIESMKSRKLNVLNEIESELLDNNKLLKDDIEQYNLILDKDTADDRTQSLDKLRLAIIQLENQNGIKKQEALGIRNRIVSNSKLDANEVGILDTIIRDKFGADSSNNDEDNSLFGNNYFSGYLKSIKQNSMNMLKTAIGSQKGFKIVQLVNALSSKKFE